MPWLATGKAGDVAIAWYGAKGAFTPTAAPASARWYVWAARSLNATSLLPHFEVAPLSETPVRFGSLCLKGPSCENENGAPADERMLDFFEIAIAPDGAVVATFNDTGRIQTTSDGFGPGPYVMFTRQTSGLGMKGGAKSPVEPSGDAHLPEEMATNDVEAFDLSGLPTSQTLSGIARISLPLAAVGTASIPSAATYSGISTDAYWLAVWKANDRVEYAGMHVDAQGNRSFFGGDQPVGIGRVDPAASMGFIEKMASYPETFSLRGGVDQANKRIWFDVPLARFHLRRGDVLHSLQAFTMTSLLGGQTFLQPLYVVDATPPQTVRIGAVPTVSAAEPRPKPASGGDRLPATGVGRVPFGIVTALLVGAAMTRRALLRRPASSSAGATETR